MAVRWKLDFVSPGSPVPPNIRERHLTPQRVVNVIQVLKKYDFNPADLPLTRAYSPNPEDAEVVCPVLYHADTNSFFMFAGTGYLPNELCDPRMDEVHFMICTPGHVHAIEHEKVGHFDYMLNRLSSWCDRLQHNMKIPDMWSNVSVPDGLIPAEASSDPISPQERELLSGVVDRVGAKMVELLAPTTNNVDALRAEVAHEFAEVKAAMLSNGKKSWTQLFWGAIFSQAFGLGIDAIGLRDLVKYAGLELGLAFELIAGHISTTFQHLDGPR